MNVRIRHALVITILVAALGFFFSGPAFLDSPGSEAQGTTLMMLDLVEPTSTSPAYAGPHNNPHKIIVRVTKPTTVLTRNDFTVTIGGGTATLGFTASVVTLYEGSDEYVLEVLPPVTIANGLYNLQVTVLIGTVALSDFEQDAVL